MELEQQQQQHSTLFTPFFSNSVNIISASTNSGKSFMVCEILKNRKFFFARLPTRAVIVLCNTNVHGENYLELEEDGFQVEVVDLAEFDAAQNLQSQDVVIFEDVQSINQNILNTINVYGHHLDLEAVFVLCQG